MVVVVSETMKPIGLRMREGKKRKRSIAHQRPKLSILDEQIVALSEELSNKSDEDFTDVDVLIEEDERGEVVKICSLGNIDDRIEPLPEELLPKPSCSKPSLVKSSSKSSSSKPTKRVVKFSDEKGIEDDFAVQARKALSNYVPASIEKKPFWCRFCRFEGLSIEDLENHRKSDAHEICCQLGEKMSFCKVCKKQFTSPHQLAEHKQGKWHKRREPYS